MDKNKNHVISDVCEGSPAEAAGIKAGDIFLKLNGEEIEDIFDYTDSNRGCFTNSAQSIYYSANTLVNVV